MSWRERNEKCKINSVELFFLVGSERLADSIYNFHTHKSKAASERNIQTSNSFSAFLTRHEQRQWQWQQQ